VSQNDLARVLAETGRFLAFEEFVLDLPRLPALGCVDPADQDAAFYGRTFASGSIGVNRASGLPIGGRSKLLRVAISNQFFERHPVARRLAKHIAHMPIVRRLRRNLDSGHRRSVKMQRWRRHGLLNPFFCEELEFRVQCSKALEVWLLMWPYCVLKGHLSVDSLWE
jgi:hypothetical protein